MMRRRGVRRRVARLDTEPSEHQEQAAVFAWAAQMGRDELDLLYAVPNGARVSMGTARKLKREGLKAGVPDLCLPVARQGAHGLYIEMKRATQGRVSEAQAWWHGALQREGYRVIVCKGAHAAITALCAYLDFPIPPMRD